ncbi:MAG: Gmad2 immunoglobulin-like domain-containing protein [bacterium]|nr:Gmad2 immunoglobulin-like domain-containing protein [bacterium]
MNKIFYITAAIGIAILAWYAFYFVNQGPQKETQTVTYSSEELGLAFMYPADYLLEERTLGGGERLQYAIVLAEDSEENRRVFAGEEPGREGPPTITISIFQNNLDNYTTRGWIRDTSFSNFKLSDGQLRETTVGNEPALAYSATGLYENDNVVIARDDFVFMFTVFYLSPDDRIRADFNELLGTVAFLNEPQAGEKDDLIVLQSPKPGDIVTSPLTVRGKARGMWYFEATFPIVLTDWDGKIIAQWYAQADGDWMTEEFVPFEGTLEFEKPEFGERGTLILRKDNPSGLPEHDDALEIPIFFE